MTPRLASVSCGNQLLTTVWITGSTPRNVVSGFAVLRFGESAT
jgi:hypothetical protein